MEDRVGTIIQEVSGRPDWIRHSRPYVVVKNICYVSRDFANQPIETNRVITDRDISDFRQQVKQNAGRFSPKNRPMFYDNREKPRVERVGGGKIQGTPDKTGPGTSKVNKPREQTEPVKGKSQDSSGKGASHKNKEDNGPGQGKGGR